MRALWTDFYELNMAASYLRRGMDGLATFSLFVRHLPANRGYLVAAGIDDCLDFLGSFSFEGDELSYLREVHGFDGAALDAFATLRFTGDVWAVPEGRVVGADEPLLEVTAPLPEAQLVETYLLNQVTFQTAIASKAARCVLAAQGLEVVDFSFRRTQGPDAALSVARISAMVGFAGTSNVEAARRWGLPAVGTMAHSYVQAFPTEREAFLAFASDFPARTTFLVDTYDTLDGVRTAVEVVEQLGLGQRVGVRLDSGDLASLARSSRALLDAAGLGQARIVASGGLDEYEIERLVALNAPIDVFGVGTKMGVSADAPYLDSVYKLVAYDGRPVMKLSPDKVTEPGLKQIFRTNEGPLDDLVGLRYEPVPGDRAPVLVPVMRAGRRVAGEAGLATARQRWLDDARRLPEDARRIEAPTPLRVERSHRLNQLADETALGLRNRRAR
jgi:nicotinate phosphoribosyltransferase